MNHRTRMGLRAGLVAALSTTLTVSPVSAGWLLRRACQPKCVPCPPNPCVVADPCVVVDPCCPPVVEDPCCGGAISGEIIHQGPVLDAPPAPQVLQPQPEPQPSQPAPVPQPEPQAEQPAEEEPEAAVPSPSDLEVEPEADTVEPEVVEPETVEPEVFEPEVVEPEVTEPEVVEPEIAEPEVAEPEVVEPEAVEPEAVEPEAVEPNLFEDDLDPAETVPPSPFDDPALDLDTPDQDVPVPADDDLFDFGAPDEALPTETPDPFPAGEDDLFGEPQAPAGEAEAPAETEDSIFGDLLGDEPAEPESTEEDEDALFEGLLEPTSTEGDQHQQQQSIFDELFSARSQQHASTIEVAVPVATVSIPATRPVPKSLDATESRLWIDNTGTFSTQGRLTEITDEYVRILKANGRTCTVPRHRLSSSDAEFVAEVAELLSQQADALVVSVGR